MEREVFAFSAALRSPRSVMNRVESRHRRDVGVSTVQYVRTYHTTLMEPDRYL
jgi:hypothetical protein